MIMRRNLIPIGLAALLAAGAVGALVAAQPPAQEHGTQSIAGWEISGGGGILIMTRRIGDNQIEYAIVGGSHAAPVSERYRVETRAEGGSCADERRVAVSNPFPAERGGEIRAQIVARLAAMDPSCALRPAQNAALIAGFEAAYEALGARFERIQTAYDKNPDPQTEELARLDADASMAMDENAMDANMATDAGTSDNDTSMYVETNTAGMDTNMAAEMEAAANAAAAAANAAAAAADAPPPRARRRPRP